MQNPATQSQNILNTFTNVVKMGGGNIRVQLRNGDVVQPTFHAPNPWLGWEEESFSVAVIGVTENTEYRWYPDGTSYKQAAFDMMEIVA
jgi:hypothetical protein